MEHLPVAVYWAEMLRHWTNRSVFPPLPCQTPCPLCLSGRLDTYQDNTFGGVWHYCPACEFAGDPIHLAASFWNLPHREAVWRLVRERFMDSAAVKSGAVEAYEKHRAKLDKTDAWWQGISQKPFLLESHDLAAFRLDVRIASGENPSLWSQRVGRWIAVSPKDELTDLLKSVRPNARPNPVFVRRQKWKNVWVIPMADLPGRLAGASLVAKDIGEVYCGFGEDESPVGIAAIHGMRSKQLNGDLIVTLRPSVAVRLQLIQMSECSEPLPIVGIWGSAPVNRYLASFSPSRRLVIWAEMPDADFFRHARGLNAHAVVFRRNEEIFNALRRDRPMVWLERVSRQAKPWLEVLAETADRIHPFDLEKILVPLRLTESEYRDLASLCSSSTKSTIQHIRSHAMFDGTVSVNSKEIESFHGCWRIAGTDELISEFQIRIDRIVFYPNDSSVYYQGVVRYRDHDVAFTASRSEIERRPFGWAQELILRQGLGFPNYNPKWQAQALNIARQLSLPEVVRGYERYGWNEEARCFLLPGVQISESGTAEELKVPVLAEQKTKLAKFKLPAPLTESEWEEIEKDKFAAAYFWTATTLVLHNFVARMHNGESKGIAMVGPGSKELQALIERMGCPSLKPAKWSKSAKQECLQLEQTGIPVLVPGGKVVDDPEWWAEPERNCIVADAPALLASVGQTNGNWILVGVLQNSPKLSPALLEIAERIVPTFFQFAVLHRKKSAISHIGTIATWLHQWYKLQRNRLPKYDLVRHVCRYSPAGGLAALTSLLLTSGDLEWARSDFPRKNAKPSIVFFPGSDELWLPIEEIQEILARKKCPALKEDAIVDSMRHIKVFLGEVVYRGRRGFVVPESWWTTYFKRHGKEFNQMDRCHPRPDGLPETSGCSPAPPGWASSESSSISRSRRN